MDLRIRALREDTDKKQKDIAAYLMCEKLALYYNVSVDYLIGLTDERRPYPRARQK